MRSMRMVVLAALTVAGALRAEVVELTQPTLGAPANASGITLDGRIDDAEWQDASMHSGFVFAYQLGDAFKDARAHFLVEQQESLWIKSDGTRLYLGFRFERAPGGRLRAESKADERDKTIVKEDSVEVFLMPDERHNIAFSGNPNGSIFDAIKNESSGARRDAAWNGRWDYRTHVEATFWSGEIAIDLSELGVAKLEPGAEWRFGVSRMNWERGLRSSWNMAGGHYQKASSYGLLRFEDGLAVQTRALGGLAAHRAGVVLHARNFGTRPRTLMIDTSICPLDPQGEHAAVAIDLRGGLAGEQERYPFRSGDVKSWTFELAPGAEQVAVHSVPVREGEPHLLQYRAAEAGTLLAENRAFHAYREPELFKVEFIKRTLTQGDVAVIVRRWALKDDREVTLTVTRDDRALLRKTLPVADDDVVLELAVDAFPPGTYLLDVASARGSSRVAFTMPGKPEWLGNRYGLSESVPPPYRPIVAGTNGVYELGFKSVAFAGGAPLPTRLAVRDDNILARPMSLRVAYAGGVIESRELAMRPGERSPRRMAAGGEVAKDGVTFAIETALEFDGFLWVDARVRSDGPSLEGVTLDIPLRRDIAWLYKRNLPDLKPFDSRARDELAWGGKIPDDGLTLPFTHAVWIGSPGGGVEWCAEDNRGWRNADPARVIEILRGQDETVLRVHFVNVPLPAGEELRLPFGLTFTPVRDLKAGAFYKNVALANWGNMVDKWDESGGDVAITPRNGRSMAFWFHGESPPSFFGKTGVVAVYPLKDNLRGEAGTIEFFARVDGEPPNSRMELLQLDSGNNTGLALDIASGSGNWASDSTVRLRCFGAAEVAIAARTEADLRTFRHYSVQWERGEQETRFSLFLDGRQLGAASVDLDWRGVEFAQRKCFLGGAGQLAVDEFRVSSVARGPATATAPFAPDKQTLILDAFETAFTPDTFTQTKATVISGASAETGAWLELAAAFVPGRFGQGLLLSSATQKTINEFAVAAGAKAMYLKPTKRWGPFWVIYNEEPERRLSRELIQAAHDQGAKTVVYYLKNISADDPYWDDFGQEIVLDPLRPSINNYVLCPEGPGEDFLVWTVAKIVEGLGVDGVHMDYGSPWACSSELHGCAWRDRDGRTHSRYPILAHRRMNMRIYALLHGGLVAEGLYRLHVSSGFVLACDHFADFFASGEMESHVSHAKHIADQLPWDRYLAYYSQWCSGIPMHRTKQLPPALCHLFSDASSPSVMHLAPGADQLTRDGRYEPFLRLNAAGEDAGREEASKNLEARTCALYYPIWDAFADSRLVAFWDHPETVRFEPADAYTAACLKGNVFLHPDGQQALVVVSNLGAEDRTVRLALDLEAWGFAASQVAVRDLYTRQVFPVDEIRVACYAEETRFILVRKRIENGVVMQSTD